MVWDELAPICLAMRTLTSADVKAFATLCELQATFTEAVLKKGTEGFDVRIERETAGALKYYYGSFGLEPASRSRMSVPKHKGEPESKWTGILT